MSFRSHPPPTPIPLPFFWILDASSAMNVDGKIESLNTAMVEAISTMREWDLNHRESNWDSKMGRPVLLQVHVVVFSSGAYWHILEAPNLDDFQWSPITADGLADMGKAFYLVADQLNRPPLPFRFFRPVLVLISSGQPTDNYRDGLHALMTKAEAGRAVRCAIAICEDADTNVLTEFIGNPKVPVPRANNSDDLMACVKWASTAPLEAIFALGSGKSGTPDVSLPPIGNSVTVW